MACSDGVNAANELNQEKTGEERKRSLDVGERRGWSGCKIRAENRDKLQIIKERAKQGKFDILLVFMFDRIGRIADETPFVVEWFVKNGIRVWSTQEGEQRFDNHTDKLTNYIRFWQADGESEKTSIRTKTALGQLVEDGGFKGGLAPYGYDLVKSGRFNKRKHEVFELAVNEAEAAVVRIIFDKYVHEGYGAQRIATYLNNLGYRARSGKMWHHATIRGILCNLTYTGVLRSGESRSPVLPHLQIIEPELFEGELPVDTSHHIVSRPSLERLVHHYQIPVLDAGTGHGMTRHPGIERRLTMPHQLFIQINTARHVILRRGGKSGSYPLLGIRKNLRYRQVDRAYA